MKLQRLPQLNPKPQIFSADKGHQFAQMRDTESRVASAFDTFSEQLLELDNSDYDYNPNKGGVVVIDRYLDNGPDTGTKVSSASLAYNRETGEVESFKVVKDDLNSVSYEHKQYDEVRSSNPTFTAMVNGRETSFDMNPQTGAISGFYG